MLGHLTRESTFKFPCATDQVFIIFWWPAAHSHLIPSVSWILLKCPNFLKIWVQKQPLEAFYKKKVFLKILQNSQENVCVRVSFLVKFQAYGLCNYIKKEPLELVFFCEFYKIFKNTFFIEHLRTTALSVTSFGSYFGHCNIHSLVIII